MIVQTAPPSQYLPSAGVPHSPLRYYRALLVLTCVLTLVLFFWGLGALPWLTFNEARRAIPASHMLSSGDWLIPMLNDEIYITKPPMLYWSSASLAWLLGHFNEWTARLPSALAACAIACMVFGFAKRHFGSWAALFALQVLIANAGFAMLGRQAGIEMLLSFFCVSALLAALHYAYTQSSRAWLLLSYALLGFAVLTKGPLALLFVTLPLLINAMLKPNARTWQVLTDVWAWLLFMVIAASWYLAVTLQLGADIWVATVQKDLVNKMHAQAGEPFYDYLLWIAVDFLPFILLLLIVPMRGWRQAQHPAVYRTLWIAFLVPLVVFSAFSDKHAKYLLPIYPLLALLFGAVLSRWFLAMSSRQQWRLLAVLLLLPTGYAVFYSVGEPIVFKYRVQALPQIAQWFANDSSALPVVVYREADARLLYYAKRHLPVIDENQRALLPQQDIRVFAENAQIPAIQAIAQCTLHTFKPYLKRQGQLVLFGFGQACTASTQPPLYPTQPH